MGVAVVRSDSDQNVYLEAERRAAVQRRGEELLDALRQPASNQDTLTAHQISAVVTELLNTSHTYIPRVVEILKKAEERGIHCIEAISQASLESARTFVDDENEILSRSKAKCRSSALQCLQACVELSLRMDDKELFERAAKECLLTSFTKGWIKQPISDSLNVLQTHLGDKFFKICDDPVVKTAVIRTFDSELSNACDFGDEIALDNLLYLYRTFRASVGTYAEERIAETYKRVGECKLDGRLQKLLYLNDVVDTLTKCNVSISQIYQNEEIKRCFLESFSHAMVSRDLSELYQKRNKLGIEDQVPLWDCLYETAIGVALDFPNWRFRPLSKCPDQDSYSSTLLTEVYSSYFIYPRNLNFLLHGKFRLINSSDATKMMAKLQSFMKNCLKEGKVNVATALDGILFEVEDTSDYQLGLSSFFFERSGVVKVNPSDKVKNLAIEGLETLLNRYATEESGIAGKAMSHDLLALQIRLYQHLLIDYWNDSYPFSNLTKKVHQAWTQGLVRGDNVVQRQLEELLFETAPQEECKQALLRLKLWVKKLFLTYKSPRLEPVAPFETKATETSATIQPKFQ